MTQVKSARPTARELARYLGADHRSLAARRAAFAAQMRAMAISDLRQVSARLRGLKKELEAQDGRKWPDYELAREIGLKPRTFQSWQNGEVENQDGKGYDKIARFYSRRLGRKITRKWIVFGDSEAAAAPVSVEPPEAKPLEDQLADALSRIERIEKHIGLSAQLVDEGGSDQLGRSAADDLPPLPDDDADEAEPDEEEATGS